MRTTFYKTYSSALPSRAFPTHKPPHKTTAITSSSKLPSILCIGLVLTMQIYEENTNRTCPYKILWFLESYCGDLTILVEQGINHIERYGTQCFGLCSLCFYVVQHKICQSTVIVTLLCGAKATGANLRTIFEH